MKIRILIALLILFSACKQKNKTESITHKLDSELNTKSEITIPQNVDSEFKLFLDFFNRDSTFQMSRIDFPLRVTDFNNIEYELSERIINKNEYFLKKFSINKTLEKENFGEYEQTITIENNKALIEIIGIDNGIAVEYEFKKNNGEWKLITWTDQST